MKKVNIIGAGIAGLAAGCYLQKNGYDTEIFELHSIPGGLCTSWQRGEYTFDGCIHWLVGSNSSDSFYNLWNELVDMSSIEFVESQEALRVEDGSGNYIRVFSDADKLEEEMLAKAPADEKIIRQFINAVRKMSRFKLPMDKAPETYTAIDKLKFLIKYLPYFKDLKYWVGISSRELSEKCTDPLLRKTFEYMFIPEMAALFLVFTQAWRNKGSAGYPIGGSLAFSRKIEECYKALGGKINYCSRIGEITVEGDSATGVKLENGEISNADIVISAADGYSTIFNLLGGKYVDNEISGYYNNLKAFPSYLQLSFGVGRTFEELPHTIVFPLETVLEIDSKTIIDHIGVRVFNFDPTVAPQGKTVIVVIIPTNNSEYWQKLRNDDRDSYKAEKDRIAKEVISAMDNRFGNIEKSIEVVDISTPATVIRYTNNWKGSLEGWILTPEVGLKQMKKTLPGLNNFYMAGQWVEPGGGLPPALMSGRNTAQVICKADGVKFQGSCRSNNTM